MNKDNAKDYLPLVQALADGKTIQVKPLDCEWEDIYNVDLDYPAKYYRIKPEPRTFDVWQHRISEEIESKSYIDYDEKVWKRITVQEVLA